MKVLVLIKSLGLVYISASSVKCTEKTKDQPNPS